MSGFAMIQVVQDALAVLKADASLSTSVGGRIYTTPPQSPSFPLITMAAFSGDDFSHKSASGQRVSFQVDVWSRYEGPLEALTIAQKVHDLLHRKTLPNAFNAFLTQVTGSRFLQDDDGGTFHVAISVEVLTLGAR